MANAARPSLRLLVGVIVVAPVLIVCAVLVTLSTISNRQIAQNLGDSYVQNAATSVKNQVGRYLADAVRVSEQYTRRLWRGVLSADDLQAWEPVMLDDLLTTPAVASICFGRTDGRTTWLLWNKGRLEVGRVSGPGEGEAIEYAVALDGTIDTEPIRTYLYDPRARPWWKVAIDADHPTWTPIYFWFGETALDGTASTGYTRPIRDGKGELLGVLIIDVTLGDIGQFLHQLAISSNAYFYILDEKGFLVATSHGSAIGADGQRIRLSQHDSEAAKVAGEAIAAMPADREAQIQRRKLGDDAVKIHLNYFRPYEGIEWRLVTVLPEAVFASEAATALRRQILLSIAAIIGGILLALLLSRQVTRPLLSLTRHVRRVGKGDFHTRIDLDAARELRVLSDEVNQMAAGLKERMKMHNALAVAQEVQQSLLPRGNPEWPGLDIAGRSRYCDETGGDYYDFIPMQRDTNGSAAPRDALLIAIGDVMGHGISAALLMTSGRAALRVHCEDEHHLGRLLTRVNSLLAHDTRMGNFMTMALIDVDPARRTLHWANAGHDVPLIYRPDQNTFPKLTGGYVPLGVLEDSAYEEYTYEGIMPGTIILLSTDGVWETVNEQDEQFGKKRVMEVVRENCHRSARDIAAQLESAVGKFRGNLPVHDDITFVVVKVL